MGVFNVLSFGYANRKKAKETVNYANYRQNRAKEELEDQRASTKKHLDLLAQTKIEAFDNSLYTFLKKCNKISKAELKAADVDRSSSSSNISLATLNTDIAYQANEFEKAGLALTGSLTAGGIAAGGTFMAVSAFGVASTGTAIGSLSGVALTNATLAWLGGGSIAAGGFGVAGGMVALGGIVLAPVAVFGMFMGAKKGTKALAEAEEYEAKIDALVEKIDTLIEELKLIDKASTTFTKTIKSVNALCIVLNNRLDPIIERLEARSLWQKTKDSLNRLFRKKSYLSCSETADLQNAINAAKLLKALIDKPVMAENGGYIQDCLQIIEKSKPEIKKLKLIAG